MIKLRCWKLQLIKKILSTEGHAAHIKTNFTLYNSRRCCFIPFIGWKFDASMRCIGEINRWIKQRSLFNIATTFNHGRNIRSFVTVHFVPGQWALWGLVTLTFLSLTIYSAKTVIVPHQIIWCWYTGRWWVNCDIWYSEEGTGRGPSPPRPLLAVPNVTAHPSAASVLITVSLYNDPLLCGFNVPIKGFK